jgi:soluble lytic murein transglycosylase
MEGPNKSLSQQLYQLNKKPKKLLTSTLFNSREDTCYSLLLPVIKQLIRTDLNSGLDTYFLYDKKIGFNSSEKSTLKKYLISRILIKEQIDLLPWLEKELVNLKDDHLIEQRIRYAIERNNWEDIEYWLAQLSAVQKQKSSWQYWQARVLENNRQHKKAEKLYQKLALKRNYYGFLAAQKLDLEYQFNAQIVTDKPQSLTHLQSQLTHIEELYLQHHMKLLKREWEALLKKQNPELQRQLGLYAYKKGWPYLSVVASIRSKSWDALNIRFPEVKPELFTSNANKYQLDPSYIYAITRQESSFDEFANSPAGARGYMQLMPSTASETAKKIGLKNYKERSQLTEGEINLQLGSAYFKMLLKRYQGNRILATAAYNAGPHRVDRWRKRQQEKAEQSLTMDSWIETIPYKETRRYVKNVLAYNVYLSTYFR